MGKLYYITGQDGQMRETVYGVILQWSQAQQMQPLQPWPAEKPTAPQSAESPELAADSTAAAAQATTPATINVAEPAEATVQSTDPTAAPAPNFYLYNYLAHGTQDKLVQLTETYGEEVVEPIYLRSDDETETELLEAGIYQSYAPQAESQTDFQTVMQELVETVFTGYQKTSYDFTAALQRLQKSNTPQTQTQTQTPVQSEKKPGKWFRKPLCRAAFFAAWFVLVCLLTVIIYNAVNSTPKPNGALISVTPVQESPPAEITYPVMLPAESDVDRTYETRFAQPISFSGLELFSGMQTEFGQEAISVVYSSGDICYIPGATSRHEKSQDHQITILLTQNGDLWQIDETGTRILWENVSHFSLAGNGDYVYFISGYRLYCYDTNADTVNFLCTMESTISALTASPSGDYCAYITTNSAVGLIALSDSNHFTPTQLSLTVTLSSVAAVSDDGQWIYGYSPGNGFLRIHTNDGSATQLTASGEFIEKLYFNESATALYYECEGALYFCDSTSGVTKLSDLTETGWNLFLAQHTDVYTRENLYIRDLYVYNDSLSNSFLRVGNTVYQLRPSVERDTVKLIEYEADATWIGENCLIMKSLAHFLFCDVNENGVTINATLPTAVSENWKQILHYSSGVLFYLDTEDQLHCYSIAEEKDLATLDCDSGFNYVFSKDGTELFYCGWDNVIRGYSIRYGTEITLQDFSSLPNSDVSVLSFWAGDGGVYVQDSSSLSKKRFYRLVAGEEPYVIYLGCIT